MITTIYYNNKIISYGEARKILTIEQLMYVDSCKAQHISDVLQVSIDIDTVTNRLLIKCKYITTKSKLW